MADTLNGIPRVEPGGPRAAWKRLMLKAVATRAGTAFHRTVAAPVDHKIIRLTRGRVNMGLGALPLVVLRSTGAKSGAPRDATLGYFTDGDDVILIASSYGREHQPGWYYNLVAHPACELLAGATSGGFVARAAEGADRDRLYALAIRHYSGYATYALTTAGVRTIPVLRLSPVDASGAAGG